MRLSGWAIFDLDGTLVDTLGEIHLALNRVLSRHGRNGLARDVVRDLVGNGPKTLMSVRGVGLEVMQGGVSLLF
jgi:phosphoglycolate phosphatase